jgi:mannose-6-phosphate isomerase-like protein (cupin superfamily)
VGTIEEDSASVLPTHASHKHPEDEFFFVLEGKAEFYLEGKPKWLDQTLVCIAIPIWSMEYGMLGIGN